MNRKLPEVGQQFFDEGINLGGIILDVTDLTSVIVEYEIGGLGYYCLDCNCVDFDKSVHLLKY